MAKSLSIKSPTEEQLAAKEHFKEKAEKEAQKLEKKRKLSDEDSGD